MKLLFLMACLAVPLAGCAASSRSQNMSGSAGAVRHVVIFKFKEGTSEAQLKKIVDGFRALKDRIPGILKFEWGTNMSPEKLDQGFTHCFVVTFRDVAARDAYLPHPAHKEFVSMLGPHLEKPFVVDYVVQE